MSRYDYIVTFAVEFAILAGGLLVYRLAAIAFTGPEFGEYVLARRNVSLLQLPLLMGLSVGVTRFIALAIDDPAQQARVQLAATLIAGTAAALAAVALVVLARPLAFLLFGTPELHGLTRALVPALAGAVFHGVAYGMLRGRLAMRAANALQLLNLGIIPPAVLALRPESVTEVILGTGIGWCVSACGVLAWTLVRVNRPALDRRALWATARDLARYGVPRVPGDAALGALFALPVMLTSHVAGVTAAGFVGVGVAVVSLMGAPFAPIGHIVLPTASARFRRGDRAGLRRDSFRLVRVAV
ncbi:MAG: hypothetical protein WD043_04245, partial [Gemmatimonadales bacterium]